MNTNPQPVVITNYDAIVEYFNNYPEQLHAPVSNSESRPISPLDYNEFKQNRSAKRHLNHHNTQWIYHIIN